MSPDDDTPTLLGATNVALHQRAATSPFLREEVNIQGNENPWKALGFDAAGLLGAHSVAEMIAADPSAVETPGNTTVTNAAALVAAVAVGGHITVIGEIVLATTLNITVAGTRLYGGFASQRAKLVLPGVANTVQEVIKISAPRVELHDLEITANNPLAPLTFNPRFTVGDFDGENLNPSNQRQDTGIRISDSHNVSDVVINGCYIHHVTFGIRKFGGNSWQDRFKIVNNTIESFNWFGIYLDWFTRGLVIEGNWIWGRVRNEPGGPAVVDETHAVPGNAIWIGDYVQRTVIKGNDCAHCDRHGIEITNLATSDPSANGGIIIEGNNIHDLATPTGNLLIRHSMGISVACGGNGCSILGNHIRNVNWHGIELHNRGTGSQGKYIIQGNHIEAMVGYGGYSAWAMSINSCTGALISGNYIKNITQESGDNVNTEGIIVWGGPNANSPDLLSWDGVTILGNEFVDAGNIAISIAGDATCVRKAITVAGNVIRLTAERQYRPTVVAEIAIVLTHCGNAFVKDNAFFYPASKPPAGNATSIGYPGWVHATGFDVFESGNVYAGDAATAPVAGSAGARTSIAGSNLTISF